MSNINKKANTLFTRLLTNKTESTLPDGFEILD
jgi:hypothetical protein